MTTLTPEKEAELRIGRVTAALDRLDGLGLVRVLAGQRGPGLLIADIYDLLADISTEREGRERAEAKGWRDAVSAVQYMQANWDQDRRKPEDKEALREAAHDIIDELISASPGEWLGTEWRSAQDWMAQISALQALIAEKDASFQAVLIDYTYLVPKLGHTFDETERTTIRRARTALNSTEAKTGEPG